MPLTDDQKRLALLAEGSDPEKFTIDDDTLETIPKPDRPPVQPTGNITTQPTASRKQFGIGETVARNAASGLLPSLAGGAGWAGGAALAPETGALSLLVPLVASIAAGWGTHALQTKALEQTDIGKQFVGETAEASQQNPKSAVVGQLASILPTMRPSLTMLKDATRGALAGDVLNPAMKNVALGAGLGAAGGAYQEYADPASLDLGRLALNIGGGALLNTPADNALARGIGLHPYVRPSLYGRPEGNLPPAAEPISDEARLDQATAKKTAKADEAAKLEAEIQKNESLAKIKSDFDTRQSEALKEKRIALEEELAVRHRTTKEQQEAKAPDYSAMSAEDLAAALREGQIPPTETPLVNPQKTSTKGVEKNNLEVAAESPEELAMRQEEARLAKEQKPLYQEKTIEEPLTNEDLVDKERLLASNRELAQHHGAELEVLPEGQKTIKTPEGKEVYGQADIGKGKATITQTKADTGAHEVVGHLVFENLPPKLQERYLRNIRDTDPKWKAWHDAEVARGVANPDKREFLAQYAGEDDLRRIATRDSNVVRDITSWVRTHVSGTAKSEDVVRQLLNRGYYGKGGSVKPRVSGGEVMSQEVTPKVTNKQLLDATLPKDYKETTAEAKQLEEIELKGKNRAFDDARLEALAGKNQEAKDKYWAMKEQLSGDASRNQDVKQTRLSDKNLTQEDKNKLGKVLNSQFGEESPRLPYDKANKGKLESYKKESDNLYKEIRPLQDQLDNLYRISEEMYETGKHQSSIHDVDVHIAQLTQVKSELERLTKKKNDLDNLFHLGNVIAGKNSQEPKSWNQDKEQTRIEDEYRKTHNEQATGKHAQDYNLPKGLDYSDLNAIHARGNPEHIKEAYYKLVETNPELGAIKRPEGYYDGLGFERDIVGGVASKIKLENIRHFVEDLKGSYVNAKTKYPQVEEGLKHVVKPQDKEQSKVESDFPTRYLSDLKSKLAARKLFKQTTSQGDEIGHGLLGEYKRIGEQKFMTASKGNTEAALHEVIHSVTDDNREAFQAHIKSGLESKAITPSDVVKLARTLRYPEQTKAILDESLMPITKGDYRNLKPVYDGLNELVSQASGRKFWELNPDYVSRAESVLKTFLGEDVTKFLKTGVAEEKYQPKYDESKDKFYSEAGQAQVNSKEFKDWFGDSKVVDAEGKPLRVFHGRISDFNAFKTDRKWDDNYINKALGGSKYIGGQSNEKNHLVGAYFTPDPRYTEKYMGTLKQEEQGGVKFKYDEGANVVPTYISLKNPDIRFDRYGYITKEERANLIKEGKDGVIAYRDQFGPSGRSLTTPEKLAQISHKDIVEIVAFHPTQIKSAIGNKGTFDSTNPDIRYATPGQSTVGGVDIDTSRKGFFKGAESSFDRVERVSVPLSQALKNWQSRRDQHLGPRNVALKELSKYPLDEIKAVVAKHDDFSSGRVSTPPAFSGADKKISDLYGGYMDYLLGVRSSSGLPAKETFYTVPHSLNDSSLDLLINKAQTPQALAIANTMARNIVTESAVRGLPVGLPEAKRMVSDYVNVLNGKANNYTQINFGNARKVADYGIPSSLREQNPLRALDKYGRRTATDLAMFQELESKPEIAGMLNIPNPVTGKVPATPAGSDYTPIQRAQEVKDAMRWVMNSFAGSAQSHPRINSFIHLINNALLGTATGVRDTASILNNAIPYVHDVAGAKAVVTSLGNLQSSYREALRTAALQPNLDKVQFNELVDSPDAITNIIRQGARLLRKWQGREAIENFNRAATFGIGRELASIYTGAARAGDTKAQAFLDKFGRLIEGDIKTKHGADLEDALSQMAKNFVDRNQGTYGGSGLPTGTMEGQFAPFLALQKWSVEKSNVIYQDVVKPFLSGENRLPMLTYTLGSVLTGAAIQELNKLLTNRKSQDPTWEETLTSRDPKQYASELTTLMQLGSYAGIVSDVAKFATDVGFRGKTPRNIVSFPAATASADFADKTADFAEAIKQGEDPWNTFKLYATDLLTHNVQAVRVLNNYTMGKDNAERSDKFRDLRVFKELEGEPVGDIGKSNRYLNQEARKFKQTGDITEAANEVPKLMQQFVEKVKENPEKAMSFLRGLKSNNYQTIPSPEKVPLEFVKFYQFLKDTQGETEAKARIADYVKQNTLNKAKSSMIP